MVGEEVGVTVGLEVGAAVGIVVGAVEGLIEGDSEVGFGVVGDEGLAVGPAVGDSDTVTTGNPDGFVQVYVFGTH